MGRRIFCLAAWFMRRTDFMRNGKKKKAAAIAMMAVLVLAMAALGISLAALTAGTESRANNFTFGNIKIELTEEKWDELTPEERTVYPGKTVAKDPKVTNTGTNDLYAYIEIQVPRAEVRTVAEDGSIAAKEWHDLFSYEVNAGWERIETDIPDGGAYSVYLYAYTGGVLEPDASTPTLFDEVTYINVLEGELEMDTALAMPVNAYAIQAGYLNETGTDVKEKMIDAYSKYKAETGK